jgi:hypothetical protein
MRRTIFASAQAETEKLHLVLTVFELSLSRSSIWELTLPLARGRVDFPLMTDSTSQLSVADTYAG